MKSRFLVTIFSLLNFAGCGGGGGGGGGGDGVDTESPQRPQISQEIICDARDNIQGCWIASGCDDLTSKGAPSPPTQYGRSLYSFNAAGFLEPQLLVYENSDCSGEFLYSSKTELDITYIVGAPILASDGTDATEITINISDDDMEIEIETIFTILDDSQLCTTQSLQLNTSPSLMGNLGDDLDYNQCLARFE